MTRLTCFLLAALALAGCDSSLDLDPQQSISNELALSTPQNIESALIGAVDRMSDNTVLGGYYQLLPDLFASDLAEISWRGTFLQPRQFWLKSVLSDNTFASDTWTNSYYAINIANNVLVSLDAFGSDQDRRDRAEGTARFVRGTLYFELVRNYGQSFNDGSPSGNLGVPLVLQPTRGAQGLEIARSTVEAVYQQAVADLSAARDLMPAVDQLSDGSILPNTYAASAVLARVYLQQGNYQAALTEANRVITQGVTSGGRPLQLESSFAAAFNQTGTSSEYVFSFALTAQDGENDLNTFYGGRQFGGRRDVEILSPYLDRFDAQDERGSFFYFDGPRRLTNKWSGQPSDGIDLPVIRLAEMYLVRAEANVRLGSEVGASPLADVNTIRGRSGADLLSSVSLSDVLNERRLELEFEGHLLHDRKRTAGSIDVPGVGSLSALDGRFLWPIPQREIDANPELVQNAFYQ